VFWGYSLASGLLSYGQTLLENKRLAVVFDLDETLLQALTEKTLKERIGAVAEKRWGGGGRGATRRVGVRGGCSALGGASRVCLL